MSENGRPFWIGALAGIVIAAAAAPAAVLFWNAYAGDRAETQAQFAALGKRLDSTNQALADMRKTASLAGVSKQLDDLNARIKSTNDALAELKKTSDGIERASLEKLAERLDTLDAGLKANTDTVAALQKAAPLANLSKQIGQVQANLTALDVTLADLKKTTAASDSAKRFDAVDASLKTFDASLTAMDGRLAAFKQPGYGEAAKRLDALEASVKSIDAALAGIKAALDDSTSALAGLQKAAAGPSSTSDGSAKLIETLDAIKKGVDGTSAGVADLQQNLKQAAAPQDGGTTDLVVIHVEPTGAAPAAQANAASAAMAPLGVEFRRIGSTEEKAQTEAILAKVKSLIKPDANCAISVAGYADTTGSDAFNLQISKKRAHNVALRLHEALATDRVQIAETAWGERRLKEWTPNGTPKIANRRVDIAVHCDK